MGERPLAAFVDHTHFRIRFYLLVMIITVSLVLLFFIHSMPFNSTLFQGWRCLILLWHTGQGLNWFLVFYLLS